MISAFLIYYVDSSSIGGQIQGFIKKENNKVEVVGNKEYKDYLLLFDIIKEVDGLSMPFQGLYIIQKQGIGQSEQQEGSKNEAIYDTYIYIKPKYGAVFSDNVINKIKIDLKDIVVEKYNNKNQICIILMKDSVY